MHPEVFTIGSFTLHSYGLLVAIAFLVGLYMASRLAAQSGLDPDRVSNLGIYVAVAAIVGAKLFMIAGDFSYYVKNPGRIFTLATLQAGGVFFGGLVAALAVAVWYMRRTGLPALRTADVFVPGIALGHSIGRAGCFLAGCCWGRPASVPWAVTFTDPKAHELVGVPLNVALHPTQIYEAIGTLILFVILYLRFRRPHQEGSILGLYLLLYCSFRFLIEFLRDSADRAFFGPLSFTQWTAIALAAVGAWLMTRTTTLPTACRTRIGA